jgi:hypothetical protein
MAQMPVGPQVSHVWSGNGPVLLANQDLVNAVTVGTSTTVFIDSQAADVIPPLGSIAYVGGQALYAIAPAGTAALLAISGGTSWAPSPAQVALQIQALGLAKDSSVLATNSRLASGVPPAVSGLDSGSQILQGPGTYTTYTFANNGRIWAANISYSMGSSGGTGSNQGYARVRVSGGATLAIVECCVVGNPADDSNTDSQTFPGLSVGSGTVIQLDVNGGTGITGVVQRGSGLVVVSIP